MGRLRPMINNESDDIVSSVSGSTYCFPHSIHAVRHHCPCHVELEQKKETFAVQSPSEAFEILHRP